MEDKIQANLKLTTIVRDDVIQATLNDAIVKGLKIVANRAIVSTLPYTLKNAQGKSPTSAMKKGAINKLKARIKGDIMGDGKVGSGIAEAVVGGDGDAIIGMKGGGYMPFVVQSKRKKGKGKKKIIERSPRFLVTSATTLLNHIYNNTRKRGASKPMVRFIKGGANYCWTTLSTIQSVVAMMQKRAGNFLSGWTMLAAEVGNKKLKSVLEGGSHDGMGFADLKVYKNSVRLSAVNDAAPPTKDKYAEMVESHIQRWANEAIRNELKYAMASLQKKRIPKKWYGKGK